MLFNTPQFFAISRRRPDPVLHRAALLAEIHSAGRQLFLLHELDSEVHSAAAFAHRHRLHGGALDLARPSPRALAQGCVGRQSRGQSRACSDFSSTTIFSRANIARLLHRPPDAFALSIILPLGISFHTFQSMSYVIDVYRGEQEPITNPIDYALFISFFPQLVAGPIVRAREFFGDLYHWQRPSSDDVLRGLLLLFLGLAKKMAMADQFAQVAERAISRTSPQHPGMLAAWTAVVAFGIQIYFDFSGYTDMAIGMAKLLGFHFPVNFRAALSGLQHHRLLASLAHVAVALAARLSVHSAGRQSARTLQTYRNLMLTMLLGGLWHGASWNFVVWGGYHGALLSFERMFRGKRNDGDRGLDRPVPAAGRGHVRAGDDRLGILSRGHVSRQPVRAPSDVFRATRAAIDPPVGRVAGADHAAAGGVRGKEGVVRGNRARPGLGLWRGVRAPAALGGTDRIYRSRRSRSFTSNFNCTRKF